MRRVLLAILIAAFLPAVSWADDIACFDYDCETNNGQPCTFDASCSDGDPFIWKINFDWGDGSTTGLTSQYEWEHVFSYSGNECAKDVTLYVFPYSSETAQVTCNIIFRCCPFGPQTCGQAGRCTSSP